MMTSDRLERVYDVIRDIAEIIGIRKVELIPEIDAPSHFLVIVHFRGTGRGKEVFSSLPEVQAWAVRVKQAAIFCWQATGGDA